MVVIDEDEDMTDIDNCFFLTKKPKQNIKKRQENDSADEIEKSKTTDMSGIFHGIKNSRKHR